MILLIGWLVDGVVWRCVITVCRGGKEDFGLAGQRRSTCFIAMGGVKVTQEVRGDGR